MKRQKRSQRKRLRGRTSKRARRVEFDGVGTDVRHDIKYMYKHVDKLWEHVAVTNTRLQNLEAQVNLISRLVTTLCIEKLGMKLKSFKRLIHRLEKEAIADSEVRDLQELYELERRK